MDYHRIIIQKSSFLDFEMAIEILQLFFRPPKVQNKRTMASSDMQAARNHLSMELDGIKQKQTKLRERVGLPSRSRSMAFSIVFFW